MRLFSLRRRRIMSCAEVGKLLQSYLDCELDAEQLDKIAEHLEACRRCGLEAVAYTRLKASLAASGPVIDNDPALVRLRLFADQLVTGQADPRP